MERKLVLILAFLALAGCNQSANMTPGIFGDSVLTPIEPIATDYGPDDVIASAPNAPDQAHPYFVDCPTSPTPENDYCALVTIEARHWNEVSGLDLFVSDNTAAHVIVSMNAFDSGDCGAVHENGDCLLALNPSCDHHAIEHGLGQCLGMGDALDPSSVMNVVQNADVRITTANVDWLQENFQVAQ